MIRCLWPKTPKIAEMKKEADEIGRAAEALQPIVDEAIRRTDNSFIAVEQKTREIADTVEMALVRDLEEGWGS